MNVFFLNPKRTDLSKDEISNPSKGYSVTQEWRQKPIQLMNCYINYSNILARNSFKASILDN
jgi:hypothetical protein